MLAEVVAIAVKRGCKFLLGEYLPTAKNGLVATLLADFGFVPDGAAWRLTLHGFKPPTTHVRRAAALQATSIQETQ